MPQENQGKILVVWNFPEFIKHKRSQRWYIFMAIMAIGLLLFALFTSNFLFAIIIILFGIIFTLFNLKEPIQIKFQILERGIQVAEKFYLWRELENFWIIYQVPETKNLYFKFQNLIRPNLVISLEDQNPLRIREILLKYLEEDLEQKDESFSDHFGKMLKI
ncbi:hypothetical protein HY750_01825 [Candidatus Kuenenbacteria bacterium]|nr:hypothetical protein [Candidatus Kuenenbacteria bacterium]